MSDYRASVRAALEATELHSPTVYSWFGRRSPELPLAVRRALTPESARSYMVLALQARLYGDYYCVGSARPARDGRDGPGAAVDTPLVEALAAANNGTGYWANGWELREDRGRNVVVRKEGLSLWAPSEDCRSADGAPLAPGGRVRMRFPNGFRYLSPGFYMAVGDEEWNPGASQAVVRWYWNLTPAGAVRFIERASAAFNSARVPYKLKALGDPAQFNRCDSVVLYTRKSDSDEAARLLGGIYVEVSADMQRSTPALTRVLAPGLGLAEDPGEGESFGLHRCGLLAEAALRARDEGRESADERLRAAEERFAEDGIELDRPYLNAGSTDVHRFTARSTRRRRRSSSADGERGSRRDEVAFLETAAQIGDRLVREAIWHDGRCNWLGPTTEPDVIRGATRPICEALGPELYSGSSGVAVFLAELYAAAGDARVREAALGAVRQALSHLEAVVPSLRLGLYSGWCGVAYAAARVGLLLGEDELLCEARRALKRAGREELGSQEVDMLAGAAGGIAALAGVWSLVRENWELDFAVRLGDFLLDRAEKTPQGYGWKSPAYPHQPPLTGYSHGAGGVACALLELFHATGEAKYRDTATRAFDYERHFFDAKAGNWPDFRLEPGARRRSRRKSPSFATAWCHGAPGIALSRLRAYELLGDETCREEARVALRRTQAALEATADGTASSYCLCHGVAGNLDVLLHGREILGGETSEDAARMSDLARAGLERYGRGGREWPCGPAGETPSLMVGLAGIGHFYLRAAGKSVGSILLVGGRDVCGSGSGGSAGPSTAINASFSGADGAVEAGL